MKRLPYYVSFGLLIALFLASYPVLWVIWVLGGGEPTSAYVEFTHEMLNRDNN